MEQRPKKLLDLVRDTVLYNSSLLRAIADAAEVDRSNYKFPAKNGMNSDRWAIALNKAECHV